MTTKLFEPGERVMCRGQLVEVMGRNLAAAGTYLLALDGGWETVPAAEVSAAPTAAEKADLRVLTRLPAGWRQDGPGRWRFDCTGPEPATGNPVFLRIQRHTGAEKGWTATRFEVRDGRECGTNGFFEPSLTKLLTHIG